MEEPHVRLSGRVYGGTLTIERSLGKFQKEYWPNYQTEGGQKEYRNYYKLVLMTSVLGPEHTTTEQPPLR